MQSRDEDAVALDQFMTVSDVEARCQEVMPEAMFQVLYGERRAPEFITNDKNIDAFQARELRPRVLVDVSQRDLSTTVLGTRIALPVIVAPTGYHARNHPDGELATARAAGEAGTIFSLSTVSGFSIEEVAELDSGPLWFQLYFFEDRGIVRMLVERAEAAGYLAIVVTVDTQVRESNERAIRFRARVDEEGTPVLREDRLLRNLIDPRDADQASVVPTTSNFTELLDKRLSWKEIEWLRSITRLPIIIKGIQSPDDVAPSVEHGVAGIVVSNHGGHAMPNSRPTLDSLGEVVDAAAGHPLEILLDGGIRTGRDVFKALALGARAVLVGRAPLFGLAVAGQPGVSRVFEILRREFDETMRYCGATDASCIDPRMVV